MLNTFFNRFFIKKCTDIFTVDLLKEFPSFLFQKLLTLLHLKTAIKNLFVKFYSDNQSQIWSNCVTIDFFSVAAEIYWIVNTRHVVIFYPELLLNKLRKFKRSKCHNVRHITICWKGKVFSTQYIILALNSPTLLTAIKANYLSCTVWLYISIFLSTFTCIRYGHTATRICSRCTEIGCRETM